MQMGKTSGNLKFDLAANLPVMMSMPFLQTSLKRESMMALAFLNSFNKFEGNLEAFM